MVDAVAGRKTCTRLTRLHLTDDTAVAEGVAFMGFVPSLPDLECLRLPDLDHRARFRADGHASRFPRLRTITCNGWSADDSSDEGSDEE